MDQYLQTLQGYLNGAPIIALLAAFAAGVLTSLTPCVYPMIPITAAYIGGRAAGQKRSRGFMLSLCYVLGIALTYSSLGAVAALTGKMFGSWTSNPIVYVIEALIFILLGLSMLDVYVLPMPKFLSRLSPKKKGGGLFGAFTVGIASSFVAAPCTSPVLLFILTIVAGKQNAAYGISLLFSYSVGMGLLLVLIGTFTGVVAALPKSGPWMDKVKRIFGWGMICVAIFFLTRAGANWKI